MILIKALAYFFGCLCWKYFQEFTSSFIVLSRSPFTSHNYFLTESKSREDKELQLSDLDDFDTIESESSECELKHRFHMNAHMATTDDRLKEPSPKLSIPGLLEAERDLTKSCLKSTAEDCEHDLRHAKTCFQQQGHPLLDSKPRIWSLAQTATSLNPTEYSSCMLRCQPSPSASSPVNGLERQQDSPVTTLRNWVDGVFHDPLFRHSSLNQAQTNTTVSWTTTTKGSILEPGALGRSVGNNNVIKTQQQEATKDSMTFPKGVNKIFCS